MRGSRGRNGGSGSRRGRGRSGLLVVMIDHAIEALKDGIGHALRRMKNKSESRVAQVRRGEAVPGRT